MSIDLDFLTPVMLTGFVRYVPTPPQYTLSQWLPNRNIGDIEAAWDIVTKTNRAAKFRSWDAETPVGKRDSFQRQRIELPPLGQKTVIGEHERLMLERVRSGGDNRARVIEAIYDDATTNTQAVLARMELARGDALTDGKFTLSGENGLTIEADFGVDPSHLVLAGTLWSDHTNSDPLGDLRMWSDTYTVDAGEPPAYALTNRTVIGDLLQNAKIRALVATMAGTPTMVSRTQLDQLLAAFDLPAIREYNTQIDVDGSSVRPIPQDRVVLMPQDPSTLGFTAWGITAEALEMAGGQNPALTFQQLPGLIGMVIKEGDPVRRWTKVGATGMPLITDPRRLMVADVR